MVTSTNTKTEQQWEAEIGVKLCTLSVNNITIRFADTHPDDPTAASLPTVLFLHGWPESWFSWRSQLAAVKSLGFRGIAPDMRGYGGTSAPEEVEAYRLEERTKDATGLLAALGVARAALVGHDLGATTGWKIAQQHPERFPVYFAMSVPHGRTPLIAGHRARCGDERLPGQNPGFHYQLHHQLPGAAASYEQDTRAALRALYALGYDSLKGGLKMEEQSSDSAAAEPAQPEPEPLSEPDAGVPSPSAPVTSSRMFVGGRAEPLWRRIPQPAGAPTWLDPAAFDYHAREFEANGWEGGLNWYRVTDLDWHAHPELYHSGGSRTGLEQPCGFLAGTRDAVVQMCGGVEAVERIFARPDVFKGNAAEGGVEVTWVDGAGHWVQQERPAETNAALLAFLRKHEGVWAA